MEKCWHCENFWLSIIIVWYRGKFCDGHNIQILSVLNYILNGMIFLKSFLIVFLIKWNDEASKKIVLCLLKCEFTYFHITFNLLLVFIYSFIHFMLFSSINKSFTFFCINRRKYSFRKKLRQPVFDKFTRFGMSWTRFDYFWKMSVCLSVCLSVRLCACDKNFVASVARELKHRISWNFIFNITPN